MPWLPQVLVHGLQEAGVLSQAIGFCFYFGQTNGGPQMVALISFSLRSFRWMDSGIRQKAVGESTLSVASISRDDPPQMVEWTRLQPGK